MGAAFSILSHFRGCCKGFLGLTRRKKCGTLFKLYFATVAQLVEQLIRNQQVAGSSPASSSMEALELQRFEGFSLFRRMYIFAFWCPFGAQSRKKYRRIREEKQRERFNLPLPFCFFLLVDRPRLPGQRTGQRSPWLSPGRRQ